MTIGSVMQVLAAAVVGVQLSAAKCPGTFAGGRQHDLRADLDQILLQARQRPVLDRLGLRQRAHEAAENAGERVKLEPDGFDRERSARQPCLLDRALALLDPLLRRAALAVEGDDILGRAAQLGDDEADAGIKLAGMPLDLGNHPTRFGPASGMVGEVGLEPTRMVRWSPDRALERVTDPFLQNVVGRKPDRIFLSPRLRGTRRPPA